MKSNLILCIFGVALLVQGIPAYPAEGSKENEVEGTPREQLLSEFVEEFMGFAVWLVEETKTVFKNTIEEAKNKPELSKYVEDLVAYNKREQDLNKMSGEDKIMEIMSLFEQTVNLLEKYIAEDEDNVEANLKEIQSLLKSKGLVTVQVKFVTRYVTLGELIDKKVKAYIDSLTSSQKAEESKLVEWFEKVQKEADIEKKIELYGDVFEILDTEE